MKSHGLPRQSKQEVSLIKPETPNPKLLPSDLKTRADVKMLGCSINR